ncbi:adhesion G-protein coupled receptor D1-like isoform X2 [Physella acuta]|uniref:adhesion G-protein coupled receptor D1-like isoform X2 n=1 Tax=Physella acuta TaxID=109671 RepID=UPI0027DE1505|nr:adhesion G-protein coupled receptor D1-like isoform X2 [Physella acuta]
MAALFNHSLHDNPIVIAPDVTNILNGFQNIGKALTNYSQATVSDESLEKFAGISVTLMNAPNDAWLDEPEFVKTGVILHTMEQIVTSSLRSFNETDFVLTNPSMTICRLRASGQIKFPKTGTQINSSMVGAHIYLPDIPTDVKYSVIIYHQLAQKVHLRNKEGLNISDKKMTSPIVSVSLPHVKISKPIELTFSHPGNFSRPTCAFLNTSLNGGQLGIWSTTGCVVNKLSNTTHTTCSCDHLTNFGLLMSPFVPGEEIFALDIISISGCSISILSLVLNLIVYSLVWRQVKDERSVLHVNLSACLLIGYIIFIAGFDRTNDVMCTVVAACLHFFFLSAVFIMLAEGINIVRMVVFVFTRTTKSFLRYLLLISYGIPVIIVGISLGVTKTEGYGRQDSCWLSVKDGLFWAFAGPVIFVNSINGVIIVVVVVTMQRSQMIRAQSIQLKIKSALHSIGVLSPILGITWLIGVFSVNEQTIVLQYIFAIINASQGLLIFLLHCVFQCQVRDALKLWIRKRFPGEVRLTNQKGLTQNNDKTESTNYSTSQNMFDVSETKVVEPHPDAEQHANMHKYENCAHLQSEKMCVQKSQENLTTEVALVENTKL